MLFQLLKGLVRFFYGKMEIIGLENVPEQNAILVGNHTQMNGPIAGELFLPDNCYTWCAGEMMNIKEVPEYAFSDFWSQKPKWLQPYYKLASYVIAPLASFIFNHARTLAVYHDIRIVSTFKASVKLLKEGKNMLIFPEKDEKYNNILYQFQDKFVDVARVYYKKTGIDLVFVPVYIAPSIRKMYIGRGITFDHDKDMENERARIISYLMNEITDIARKLPEHKVVPYRNIPKKYYLSNKDIMEVPR